MREAIQQFGDQNDQVATWFHNIGRYVALTPGPNRRAGKRTACAVCYRVYNLLMIRAARDTKAVLLFLACFTLCVPALTDLAAGQRAVKNGDYATALKEFLPLAQQGDAIAQYNLGTLYRDGHGVVKDYKEAVRWFRLAGEQSYSPGQSSRRFAIANAQYSLGNAYAQGLGVPHDDHEAARWYRQAAEHGALIAQYNLGISYRDGKGVPRDYKEAARWFRAAAESGDEFAESDFGILYQNGQGVPQNYMEAARLYRLAAEQGYATAEFNLGGLYYKGQGVSLDYSQAYMWFTLAGARGYARAIAVRDILANTMTPDQINLGERLSPGMEAKNRGGSRFAG